MLLVMIYVLRCYMGGEDKRPSQDKITNLLGKILIKEPKNAVINIVLFVIKK